MQHILQTGLSAGMSAVSGIHSNKPNPVDPKHNSPTSYLPQSFVPTSETRITLRGKHHNVSAPIMNIGAWSWGDSATWHWSPEEKPNVHAAWKILREGGINWIDTAQAYGSGESERICADLFEGLPRESFIIQTKWYVVPNVTNVVTPFSAPVKMLKESLERLKLDYVDVYLIHGHIAPQTKSMIAKALADCVDQGLARTVGVANYAEKDMLELAEELKQYGVPLATNQCEFSVLRRHPEVHGLIKACRDNDIVFQSYSSVAQGRLTGKYSVQNPPPKTHRFSAYDMEDVEPVLKVLEKIAEKRGVSVAAVALNYNISKGAVPTVGVRSAEQARGDLEALGWRLSEEEAGEIDAVSFEGTTTVLWQQG